MAPTDRSVGGRLAVEVLRPANATTLDLCQKSRSLTHRVIVRSRQDAIENTVLGLETLDDIAILTGMLNPAVNSALS